MLGRLKHEKHNIEELERRTLRLYEIYEAVEEKSDPHEIISNKLILYVDTRHFHCLHKRKRA